MIWLSYSQLQTYAECRYSWFANKVLGLRTEPTAPMIFGRAIDEALTAANEARMEGGIYLQPEIIVPVFREVFDKNLPEDNPRPGLFSSSLDYFWRGEDPDVMRGDGEELLHLYFAQPWAPEDEDFVPLKSADDINPEGVQLELSFHVPGDRVEKFVGVLDVLDSSGVVIDYKARKRAGSWDSMDFDLQPTAYAALMGGPVLFQFIELVRGDRRAAIKSHATQRGDQDIEWFQNYLLVIAREIDERMTRMVKELGEVEQWQEDPAAVAKAADFFPPSPGRRCAFEAHFTDCRFRAGRKEE